MAKYLDTAMWAKLSKREHDWQWAIYDEMGILLCVLSDNGFCELARDLWKATGRDNQVDEHTHWLGETHPPEQWLKKKLRSFEKKRTWQHLLKHATCVRRDGRYWVIDVEESRWLGPSVGDTAFVTNLCSQLNVPFDENQSMVNLR